MAHEIHVVTGFEKVAPFTLRVDFEDGTSQVIDFRPLLHGEIFGPLRDPDRFDRVRLDEESGTLTWPNGADFDPAMLHDWPKFGPELAALAKSWTEAPLTTKR
jgi:Protein of unknown function (DUF2442)